MADQRLELAIAIPGNPGESCDWLNILEREGVDTVRRGILNAGLFVPSAAELEQIEKRRRARMNGHAGPEDHTRPEDEPPAPPPIKATPYEWCDPEAIPPRQWLYRHHVLRGFVSCTVSPGGVGKTSLVIAEALAMVTGRPLLGVEIPQPLRVWIINLEDPLVELKRRIQAACRHYGITAEDIGGRLFVDSGRDTEVIIATETRDGVVVAEPVVEAIVATMLHRQIDVVQVDPFVSSHQVEENKNTAIDRVVKTWGKIVDRCNAGVDLVHHTRKGSAGVVEFSVEDGRGAIALVDASRSARVLNPMSKDEAEGAGVDPGKRRLYFRTDNGKANLAPPAESANWFRLASVELGNGEGAFEPGDNIQVATGWEWPSAANNDTVDNIELRNIEREFMEAVTALDKKGQRLSTSPNAGNFAPKLIRKLPSMRKHALRVLDDAMYRLLEVGKIEMKLIGSPSKHQSKLVVVSDDDPDESA